MAEIVRVAVAGGALDYKWPRRCPRCGTREFLAPSTCRVGRATFDLSGLGGGFAKRTEVMTLSVPMCQRHADANDVANMILEGSPLMTAVRGVALLALAKAASLLFHAARHGGFKRHDVAWLVVCALVGLGGVAAMAWADRNAAVRPMRFDPDVSVLKVRFADERYAEDFKDANPADTDPAATAPPAWYERSAVWVIGALAVLLWIAR